MIFTDNDIISACKDKIMKEAKALNVVADQVDETYAKAIRCILECKGKVIITGLGKTGHIGKKIAASFASLGIPSFFVHSCESLHGDLGMITADDLLIMISNSGRSQEILNMLPTIKKIGVKTISITRDRGSSLALNTDIAIVANVGDEIDHLNLAPTASSTAALAVGDALAVVACELRGFKREDYALRHPAGALGQKLADDYQRMVKQA